MKRYFAKVYDHEGNFITTWKDFKFYSFTQTLNGGLGQLQFDLARRFSEFSVGGDVALNNEIQLWVQDKETPSQGLKIYSGFISAINPYFNGKEEGVKVYALGYYAKLAKSWFTTDPLTSDYSVPYTSKDPAYIAKDIIDNYRAGISGLPVLTYPRINHSNVSVPANTGNTVSYTFKFNTHAEALEITRKYAPADWWFFIGADNLLQFKEKNPNPSHILTLGKDFQKLDVFKNMENITNYVLFWNGLQDTDPDLILQGYNDLASVGDYDIRWEQRTDGRVSDSTTADAFGQAMLAENKDPEVRIVVEVLDSNGSEGGYDIESIQVGDTVNLRGFSALAQSLFEDEMQVYALTYEPNKVILELEGFQTMVGRTIDQMSQKLEHTVNTDTPS